MYFCSEAGPHLNSSIQIKTYIAWSTFREGEAIGLGSTKTLLKQKCFTICQHDCFVFCLFHIQHFFLHSFYHFLLFIACCSVAAFLLFLLPGEFLQWFPLFKVNLTFHLLPRVSHLDLLHRKKIPQCSIATKLHYMQPSEMETFLHVAVEAHFLFLFLQSKFQRSWLPSFRSTLPRRYFSEATSLFSVFCQAWVLELPFTFSHQVYCSTFQ